MNKNITNLTKRIFLISILTYLFLFDQIFYFYDFKIDMRISLLLLTVIPLITNKNKDYLKMTIYWIIFITFFYLQSLLKFGDINKLDYTFFNLKNLSICLFLSIILLNIKNIYISFNKIVLCFILIFPFLYIISRIQIFYYFSNEYEFIEIFKFTFGNIRIFFLENNIQSNILYLFKEQSHFNMIGVLVIINFLFFINKIKNRIKLIYIWINFIFFYFVILINLSSTFVYGYALTIFFIYILFFKNLNKYFIINSLIILIITINFSSNNDKIKEISLNFFKSLKEYEKSLIILNNDIDEENQKKISKYKSTALTNLSFEVYLFNLKLSSKAFSQNPFGYGLNSYNLVHDKFFKFIPNKLKGSNWLNKSNGSNLLFKSLAEFGIFMILFGIMLATITFNKKVNIKKKIIIVSGLFTIVAIRGAGYVNAGFLIFFILSIYELKNLLYKINIKK